MDSFLEEVHSVISEGATHYIGSQLCSIVPERGTINAQSYMKYSHCYTFFLNGSGTNKFFFDD